jgi:hypothetical protein
VKRIGIQCGGNGRLFVIFQQPAASTCRIHTGGWLQARSSPWVPFILHSFSLEADELRVFPIVWRICYCV